MNRIDRVFSALRAGGRKALVPFITAGDPSLAATVAVMHALVAAGADAIELGVPFSDPMADGPVIQRSSERALARGVGTAQVLAMVREFRVADLHTPVVLMGYLNPVAVRGGEAYAGQAAAAGVDGVLLVDLPAEHAQDLRGHFDAHGLALIALAAPTTSEARLATLARQARGYLYYVSFAGVTGARQLDVQAVRARVAAIRTQVDVPVLVGFGVRDGATAKALAEVADGVVVGSALVEAIAAAGDAGTAAAQATAFLAPLRAALDGRG